ncbi:MAG: 2,3-bisphosphoglycerate-independent phosphoglycerate mutase [Bacilli bacterium]|nr:2,3-bisphosphoglycerate-independent phosphoglycerate mutase [Bacilli bacterium]
MNKVLLMILDGVGIREEIKGNAVKLARMPNFNMIWNKYPHSLLDASGPAVGLPINQMGNSEVGHLNIGAGRIVYQPLQLINEAIKNNSFYNNDELLNAIKHSKENNSNLHIMGLLSDGGVHSHIDHFKALIKLAKINNINNLYIHIITDGRDTLPNNSYKYIEELQQTISEYNIGEIATISGRYYAMDRDNNWDRTKKYYETIVNGNSKYNKNIKELIENSYKNNILDEFIEPTIINKDGLIKDNDSIIWVNYRPDRAKQILSSLTNIEYMKQFNRIILKNLKLTTMLKISDTAIYKNAFNVIKLENTLGEYISKKGLKQLRIAETEKYAHVTYFFDGGIEKQLDNCDRVLIPSPKVATYDLKPEMSANLITDKLLEIINNYDLTILNFANGDMVGHTGNLEAAIKALEVVDNNLGKIYNKCNENKITIIIIADHGNCEQMLDENNNMLTSHTYNKVPCIITDNNYKVKDGKLADIAPTILKIMNLNKPIEMTGNELI